MDTIEEKKKALLDRITALPENEQSAIGWLIEHRAYATRICRVKPLTEEARTRYMEQAIQRDDALMKVLLLLEKRVNVDGLEF